MKLQLTLDVSASKILPVTTLMERLGFSLLEGDHHFR